MRWDEEAVIYGSFTKMHSLIRSRSSLLSDQFQSDASLASMQHTLDETLALQKALELMGCEYDSKDAYRVINEKIVEFNGILTGIGMSKLFMPSAPGDNEKIESLAREKINQWNQERAYRGLPSYEEMPDSVKRFLNHQA